MANERLERSEQKFPQEHEEAVVSLLLQLPDTFRSLRPVLKLEHFQLPEAKLIVGVMFDLFDEHGVAADRQIVTGECKRRLTTENDFEPVLDLLARPLAPSEVPIIKSEMAAWLRHHHFRRIYAEESIEAFRAGDYKPLEDVLKRAQEIEETFGETQGCLVETWEDISRPKDFRIIPTPWEDLNGIRGGLETGDHIGIAGPTSAGKSQILLWLAAECVRLGLYVLYIDFENRATKLLLNFAAALGRADALALDLKDAHNDQDLANAMSYIRQHRTLHPKTGMCLPMYAGNLSGKLGVDRLAQEIEKAERKYGLRFDVIIVDYFDHLYDEDLADKRGQWIMERELLQQWNVYLESEGKLGYSALQCGSGARTKVLKGQEINEDDISGSVGKRQRMQFLFLLHRKPGSQTAHLELTKAREAGWMVGCRATYAHHQVPGTRGYLEMGTWYQPMRPEDVWNERKEILEEAIRNKGSDRLQALEVEAREKAKWFGHAGIKKDDLRRWFGDKASFNYALGKMNEAGWILETKHCAFNNNAHEKKTWIIFRDLDSGE